MCAVFVAPRLLLVCGKAFVNAWGVMATDLLFQTPAISFGDAWPASGSFKTLFRDGMALVEETAAYLDGDGREEAKRLPRVAGALLRLGEHAADDAAHADRLVAAASAGRERGRDDSGAGRLRQRRTRIAWQQLPSAAPAINMLPDALQALIDSSMRLQDRIVRLDTMMVAPDGAP